MSHSGRHDRTVRLLAAQLEAIATTSERAPGRSRDLEPLVARARAATRHALRLELITSEEAGAIWAEVARRHPGVRWAQESSAAAAEPQGRDSLGYGPDRRRT